MPFILIVKRRTTTLAAPLHHGLTAPATASQAFVPRVASETQIVL
jgi:hypothetical protein